MTFAGLHIHTHYSLLDGASQIPQLIDSAVALGMPAIAITDHGVMYGAVELIKATRGKSIKPIIGNEMYIINEPLDTTTQRVRKYHQVVLAKNTQGYKNLVKLTTISHLQGVHGKGIVARPCVNKDLLKQYREGLIVTSACLGGEVPQAILQGNLEKAREVAQWYRDVFGDNYYLELQDHGSQEDRIVNVELVKLARALDIKIIATNDSHFISCYDVEAHDALLCINTGQQINEVKRMRYSGTEYLKSAAEMALLFRDHLSDDIIQEAIANTVEVANKIEPYHILGEPRIPNFPVPAGHTADTYVEEIAWEGLLNRFGVKSRAEIKPAYKERLEYELKMIERMGFSTYFLVVWDYIKYARDHHIPVGPGRGSAAGSLVAYTMGITNIDPVHHGLLFERFLNPERKSMPDIDTDFCIEGRDKVIEYVTERYGEDRVAQIITFNRMTSKAVLKDVARVLGVPYGKADQMAKLIPVSRGKPEKLSVMISDATPEPDFKKAYDSETIDITNDNGEPIGTVSVRQWLDMAIRIEGTNKTFGVHAAGVVISADPLDEIVPLQRNNDGSVITQYSMEELEALGLLKMDFLGLRNLTIIQKTLDYIKQTHNNLQLDPYALPADERKAMQILAEGRVKKLPGDIDTTYKLLERGDLEGVFQLESSGMRQIVQELKPSCIEDISSILALYRPGPLDAGLIPKFIARKHGEKIQYEHALLQPILEETYGILVYQEQIMKMAQDLAGYSLGQADLLRRAMGKKKPEEMNKQRELFIDGSTKNGVPQKVAEQLFEQMVLFAEYCFNKSHSTAYAYVTYQTAYLKANYPAEYMAALLTANSGDQDKVKKYIANCGGLEIEVEPPDINRSQVDFTIENGKIVFGLSAVKNLGQAAIEHILVARDKDGPFKSLPDLCDRVDLRAVNSRALESLIKCGALDKINRNRKQLIAHLELSMKWAAERAKEQDSGQLNLFSIGSNTQSQTAAASFDTAPKAPDVKDYPVQEKLQFEKELLGFYLSNHPLKDVAKIAQQEGITPVGLAHLEDQRAKSKVTVIVIITDIKAIATKKGDQMAILQIEDLEGKAEAVVFPRTYTDVKASIATDVPIIIKGKVDKRDEQQAQILVEELTPISVQSNSEPKEDGLNSSYEPGEDGLKPNYELKEDGLKPNYEPKYEPKTDKWLLLQLTPEQVISVPHQQQLRSILQEYSGGRTGQKVPVVVLLTAHNHHNQPKAIRLAPSFWVQDVNGVVNRLNTAGFKASVLGN
ncbi:MAG TPA: DNA polymerase III subunit alpha [Oscillatoriaceae cyanobacterium M33_DOE_052]|uniref:DNA polymerase III subunit alpha n=1 Tax=Planktothricoides sp. SpSt-374 TaxID=2282167 RepID=A0A7C3ZZA4_9CYAN|nr:DNA polymerase III subunit alpha [Oscillatoriaceae cyanobacterium M33_DOE_052]